MWNTSPESDGHGQEGTSWESGSALWGCKLSEIRPPASLRCIKVVCMCLKVESTSDSEIELLHVNMAAITAWAWGGGGGGQGFIERAGGPGIFPSPPT